MVKKFYKKVNDWFFLKKYIQILKKSDEPVKGSELSAELQVSRQVVVKDIALLRASGIEILATSNGYIVLDSVKNEFKIKCKNHNLPYFISCAL